MNGSPLKSNFLLPALIAGLGLTPVGRMRAQTFTTLHNFTAASADSPYTNSDGYYPQPQLILSSNTLYGAATRGGSSGNGTLFKVNTDGTGFTNMHIFTATASPSSPNSDGAHPESGLVLLGSTLYGTADSGGSFALGTLFKISTDGTGFTPVYSFSFSDEANPYNSILWGNILYGTSGQGGSFNAGSVFKMTTNGTGVTTLHSFTPVGYDSSSGLYTNSDGQSPSGSLVVSSNILYGTAASGGRFGNGTVFAVNTNGTGFTNLHTFAAGTGSFLNITNADGAQPRSALVLSGNTLYGTTFMGGSSGAGTLFKINTDGSGFANLHIFTNGSDGANPLAALILSGNTLYGTASSANNGSSGSGTVFALNTNGTGFTVLHTFAPVSGTGVPNSDGAYPDGLMLALNTLYGTTIDGGSSGYGTVFSLSLPLPLLTATRSGSSAIISWPSPSPGFVLQQNLNVTDANGWSNFVGVVSDDGTNKSATTQANVGNKFFRLSMSPPTLSINSPSITEGNSGQKPLNFTVTRSGDLSGTSAVSYVTVDFTATAGSDYVATSGTLTFGPGVPTQTISVLINGDTTVEPTEFFGVFLTAPTNATIPNNSPGVGAITNDD